MSTSAAADLSLDLHASGQRLRKAVAERERLLRRIARLKVEVGVARERAEQAARAIGPRMTALFERLHALHAELRALFAELLAPGRLSRRAQRAVREVAEEFDELGLRDDPFGEASPSSDDADEDVPAAAAPAGRAKDQASLRTLFRRLSLAIHPDHATDDADRERRTEAMKVATGAYRDGDLARLLELEADAAAREVSEARVEEPSAREARLRELTEGNRTLRAQTRALERERRELRDAVDGAFAEEMLGEAERDLAGLAKVRDFVISFRDGKITLDDFIVGPPCDVNPYDGDDDDLFDLDDLELIFDALDAQERPPRRRKRASRAK